jgi:hypothetical protein
MQSKPITTTDDLVELLIPSWSTALGVEVTAESDFLALGGTSLAALAVAGAVAERYDACEDIELIALEAVFEAPTLLALAGVLAARINERATA